MDIIDRKPDRILLEEQVTKEAISIFFSYSRKDLEMRNRLDAHLSVLKNSNKIRTWHDLQLPPGSEWEPTLLHELNTADIILLLVSVDFLASKYCYSTELKRAIERHHQEAALVIPVILSWCEWNYPEVPFSKLNVLPTHAEPIASSENQDKAFSTVARQIREAVENLRAKKIKRNIPSPQTFQDFQNFQEDLGDGIKLDLVAIVGKQFLMGSPSQEAERYDDESPQHRVGVRSFWLGQSAVTQEQWWVVATQLPKINHQLDPDPSHFKGNHRPVEQVSWWEAVEFCDRLSRKTGKSYRLPSEAEWEYACRAGTTTPFHFGETITPKLANYGSAHKGTTEVGKFPATAFGLYDMHGNVWEWCADYWHENYQGAAFDGSAWISGGNSEIRVMRGGSWNYSPQLCRSACRDCNAPGDRNNNLGFRVVCGLA